MIQETSQSHGVDAGNDLREQLYNLKVKEKKKENRDRVLFDGPIFTQEWYHDDDITNDNIEAYMF